MKKSKIMILLVAVLCMAGCSTANPKNEKQEEVKLSEVQQNDVNIANDLYKAASNLETVSNFHLTGTTQGGDYYDVNISGNDYAGSYTHTASVNGVPQQMTDYCYKRGESESSYMTFSGKILPYSENFGTYIRDYAVTNGKSYKDIVPTEVQEGYTTIFEVTKNADGSKVVKVLGDTPRTFTISSDSYIVAYADEFGQTFNADSFNSVVLDYTYSGF